MTTASRLWIGLAALTFAVESRGALPEADPKAAGFDPVRLKKIDAAVEQAIQRKQVAGAVVLVGRDGKVAYFKAHGQRAVEPSSEPMTRDTIFDMASLTKPIATATSVLKLVEQGKIKLSDSIVTYLPEFDQKGKKELTIDLLLRHRTGLIADNAIGDYANGPEKAWERIAALKLNFKPGEKFLYSDVNYLILGRLVERVSGKSLDEFSREMIFEPLDMTQTGFAPIGEGETPDPKLDLKRCAPTEKEKDKWVRGVVHDPRARALGGVAGHAGLFSTAEDVAVYAQMLLDGGKTRDGKVILEPETIEAMLDPGTTPPRERRGLGWDLESSFSHPRGRGYGLGSFGHTGFTGTSLWVDPASKSFVVILTSRLHPFGPKGNSGPIRIEVATLAALALLDRPAAEPVGSSTLHPVHCGIDVLVKNRFAPLKGKRVALVTNHTGKTKDGLSTIDALAQAPDVQLKVLFSPEHGIRGLVDKEIGDSKDEKTGLPIKSLYGKSRKPSKEQLEDIDVLVYDIQDIGARFYTYISTLGLAIEAAKESGIPILVLDRPNPIGGVEVAGPIRDDEFEAFIAHHALPVRHGMTVGELAQLFNAERKIEADLQVIPCEGWKREDLFDWTGLTWTNPSPNMRSLTEALLYPGVGLLEATNLATGRGTDTPFERLGAPWINAREFAAALNARELKGVRFVPNEFIPKERQFSGENCKGVQIFITDRDQFDPVALGIELASVLRDLYPDQWKPDNLLKFIADRAAYDALVKGERSQAIMDLWKSELEEFRAIRSRYLLYK